MYLTVTLGSALVGRRLLKTTTTRPFVSIAASTSPELVVSIGSLSSCTLRDHRKVPSALITVTQGVLSVPVFAYTYASMPLPWNPQPAPSPPAATSGCPVKVARLRSAEVGVPALLKSRIVEPPAPF